MESDSHILEPMHEFAPDAFGGHRLRIQHVDDLGPVKVTRNSAGLRFGATACVHSCREYGGSRRSDVGLGVLRSHNREQAHTHTRLTDVC